MKNKLWQACLIVLCLTAAACAQFEPGKVEVSTSASAQIFISEGEADFLVNIPVRVGIVVSPGLEVEPELILTLVEEADAAYIFTGNLTYNFPSLGKTKFFLTAGGGFSNAAPYHNSANSIFGGGDETATIFQVGVGDKTFLADKFALRTELRFQNFSSTGGSFRIFSLLVGFSVLLP